MVYVDTSGVGTVVPVVVTEVSEGVVVKERVTVGVVGVDKSGVVTVVLLVVAEVKVEDGVVVDWNAFVTVEDEVVDTSGLVTMVPVVVAEVAVGVVVVYTLSLVTVLSVLDVVSDSVTDVWLRVVAVVVGVVVGIVVVSLTVVVGLLVVEALSSTFITIINNIAMYLVIVYNISYSPLIISRFC